MTDQHEQNSTADQPTAELPEQGQPAPSRMDGVMDQLEAARAIEEQLRLHQEELKRFDDEFSGLRSLRDELRGMALEARGTVLRQAHSDLDRVMADVIAALNARKRTDGIAIEVDPAVEELASDVLVEALSNIARHSQATESNFSVKREESWLFVSVFDNGVGNAAADRGRGLSEIQRRVNECGGHFSLSSPPGRGTLLTVGLPSTSTDPTSPTDVSA